MKGICFCCKKEKEVTTEIDGRIVCDSCNHLGVKKEV